MAVNVYEVRCVSPMRLRGTKAGDERHRGKEIGGKRVVLERHVYTFEDSEKDFLQT